MSAPLHLCLVLHNHQPVGNFDHVFQQAYEDSYLPFLEVFEQYPQLKISLHTSGPLMEWFEQRHPEYLNRLSALVSAGRVEIVGGAFYEPILTMIPSRDRVGQIAGYTRWLQERLGGQVRGMWMPERVWEQSLASDLAEAGIEYTVLDDFHFRNAGLDNDALHGYYLSEDDGRVLSIFPGSERLRYLIPFADPQETIHYLREVAERHPGAVVVFGDDGEKFGTWPETHKHVYENGWLRQFFDALVANGDWLHTSTLAEAIEQTPPTGKIYLPDGSYREMTEWALPTERQEEYDHIVHEMEGDSRWEHLKRFVRGGFWRNFKVKYPEANTMYSRMMMISRRLDDMAARGVSGEAFEYARRELYRGQCNCPYWHGAFGGIYLPHLRNAIFNHLIAAENLLDAAAGRASSWVEAEAGDFNFDARQEVALRNDRLACLLAPAQGGSLYELDIRSICLNLLATIARRPEAYHRKILAGANQGGGEAKSIHDRVVFKQEGLDQRLQYDSHLRNSLLDHFYDSEVSPEAIARGEAEERGDFLASPYEATIRRNPERIQVVLTRQGWAAGHPVRIIKGITLEAGSPVLEIAYRLEDLPPGEPLHFSVELNFAGLPSGADDRYFHHADGARLGRLETRLNLHEAQDLALTDEWLGIDCQLQFDRPTGVWTYPVETVSQSEGGFELVHQSVVVQPHWHVQGDENGRWAAQIRLTLDTSLAESRMESQAVAAAT